MDNLVKDLKDQGFTVVLAGVRWRVTDPEGGDAVFLPQRLGRSGSGANVSNIMANLKRIGFDPEKAEAAREADQQERLRAAQRQGQRQLAAAEAAAAKRPTPAAFQEAVVRQRISPEELPEELGAVRTPSGLILPGGPRSEAITLDGDFAMELLKHNQFYDPKGKLTPEAGERMTNRPFIRERAIRYRDVMLAKKWRLTHQGVALDTTSRLVDGQHRLVALTMACEMEPGTTIQTMVTYDLEPEVFDAVDIGAKRTTGDVLAAHGEKNALHLAAIARVVIFYDQKRPPGEWSRNAITPQQAMSKVQAEPGLRDATRWATTGSLALPSAEGAARHLIIRESEGIGREKAMHFFETYRSGAGIEKGDPVYKLREVLINALKNAKRTRDPLEHLSLLIKAWNAEVQGKRMFALAWRKDEEIPRIIVAK